MEISEEGSVPFFWNLMPKLPTFKAAARYYFRFASSMTSTSSKKQKFVLELLNS